MLLDSLTDDEMAVLASFDKNQRIVVPMCNGRIRDLYDIHYPFNAEF